MLKNRDVFEKDPTEVKLLNDGVADVKDSESEEDLKVLRYELETFVCDGQYQKGLNRILDSYTAHVGQPQQPGVWISGFYGSGKSHLAKMLRALWEDYTFNDGASARGLAHLPTDIKDLLKELDTQGKRYGGLKAASGTLREHAGENVRLIVLAIIFKSCGLPQKYPIAQFVMWLRDEGLLEKVRAHVESKGKNWDKELQNLYVSTTLAEALIAADPNFATSPAEAKSQIRANYQNVEDISNDDFVSAIRRAVAPSGKFPCFLLVLDEVQQFIGTVSERADFVQEVAETLQKRFDGKLLVVATGQAALNEMPLLEKIQGRFTVQIALSDQDVEAVIRKIILAKKPARTSDVDQLLTTHSGEISRHLNGTKIGPNHSDHKVLIADYPLLPTRRRFWERTVRAMDVSGTGAQLRTQLKIVHEAVRGVALKKLGSIIPADYLYQNLSTKFLQTGAIPREVHDLIAQQADGTDEGRLRNRICALVFLLGKLPRDGQFDLGLRAKPEVLCDLLVEDLNEDSAGLRKRVPEVLDKMVEEGHLMKIDEEYRIQTRESMEWENEYQRRYAKILNDAQRLSSERADLLNDEARRFLQITHQHGHSKVPRSVSPHFGSDKPSTSGVSIPVWVRNGWDDTEKSFENDAVSAPNDDPTIYVFLPRRKSEELNKRIAAMKAARETLDFKGTPTTDEGREARDAMETRAKGSGSSAKSIAGEIIGAARVLQAGGQEMSGLTLHERVEEAIDQSLVRLFPRFDDADNPKWSNVIARAKQGDLDALSVLGYKGDAEKQSVCAAVLKYVAVNRKGADVRKEFLGNPYGWPQDAIDGALYVITVTGHVRCKLDNAETDLRNVAQGQLGKAEFKAETVTVGVTQRLAVRKVLQSAGIKFKPNEEGQRIPELVDTARLMAKKAGGEAPLPESPSTAYIDEIAGKSGNDQIVAVADAKDRLSGDLEQWEKTASLIEKRLPAWQALKRLQYFASTLPEGQNLAGQIKAIEDNRSLLSDPDPVPGYCKDLTQALRDELKKLHGEFEAAHQTGIKSLEADECWQKLDQPTRDGILAEFGLSKIPTIDVKDQDAVLRSLDAINLSDWRTLIDALPARFAKAHQKAIQITAPKTKHYTVPGRTVNDEAELDAWLDEVKQQVMDNLNDGPVRIN